MSASYLYVNYTPVSTPIAVPAIRGAKNFLPWDEVTGQQNPSTSGQFVETVNQSIVVMVSFTLEAMLTGSGWDLDPWMVFARWALGGGTFILAPNYPASSKEYNCAAADGWKPKPKYVAPKRYSVDFQFRILQDSSAPASADEVLQSFWGLV